MLRALLVLLLLAPLPTAAASFDPCGEEVASTAAAGHRVSTSVDGSPCVAVDARRPGPCLRIVWGVDLGVLVVGGADTCQALVKADALP